MEGLLQDSTGIQEDKEVPQTGKEQGHSNHSTTTLPQHSNSFQQPTPIKQKRTFDSNFVAFIVILPRSLFRRTVS